LLSYDWDIIRPGQSYKEFYAKNWSSGVLTLGLVCTGQLLSTTCWTVCTGPFMLFILGGCLYCTIHAEFRMLGCLCWSIHAQCPMLGCLLWAIHAEYPILDRACWVIHAEPSILGHPNCTVHGGPYLLVVPTGSFLLAVHAGFIYEYILSHLCWAIHYEPSLSMLCSCWATAINPMLAFHAGYLWWISVLEHPVRAVHTEPSMLGFPRLAVQTGSSLFKVGGTKMLS
jgi:hypothetical protein